MNLSSTVDSFQDEICKENAISGSWEQNYSVICDKFNCVGCPYFILTNSTIRVQNCIIDISSWRCMLLALSISTPTITELSVHNCHLSPQHLIDLTAALTQSDYGPKVLRLEYLYFESAEERQECMKNMDPLFTSDVKLEHLSLRSTSVDDEVLTSNAASLQSNFILKSLNLSCNNISDIGANALLRVLRINTILKEVSISRNNISGESSFDTLQSLMVGSVCAPEDDVALKANTKSIAENNKKIKEMNKKRKKNGLAELPELAAPKKDQAQKINGQLMLCNRTFSVLDMSLNPIDIKFLISSLDVIRSRAGVAALVTAFGQCSPCIMMQMNAASGLEPLSIPPQTISQLSDIGISVLV